VPAHERLPLVSWNAEGVTGDREKAKVRAAGFIGQSAGSTAVVEQAAYLCGGSWLASGYKTLPEC
jgi:hypothetical protein